MNSVMQSKHVKKIGYYQVMFSYPISEILKDKYIYLRIHLAHKINTNTHKTLSSKQNTYRARYIDIVHS